MTRTNREELPSFLPLFNASLQSGGGSKACSFQVCGSQERAGSHTEWWLKQQPRPPLHVCVCQARSRLQAHPGACLHTPWWRQQHLLSSSLCLPGTIAVASLCRKLLAHRMVALTLFKSVSARHDRCCKPMRPQRAAIDSCSVGRHLRASRGGRVATANAHGPEHEIHGVS